LHDTQAYYSNIYRLKGFKYFVSFFSRLHPTCELLVLFLRLLKIISHRIKLTENDDKGTDLNFTFGNSAFLEHRPARKLKGRGRVLLTFLYRWKNLGQSLEIFSQKSP